MRNETLILKSGVSTGSTIKLTDCPIKSGEIFETVCRLYANGLTSGNRAIKALGESVKYNTEAVSNGSLYCVAYKDGGFYVGARESEDYEPKVGDWWFVESENNTAGGGSEAYFNSHIIKSIQPTTEDIRGFIKDNFFVAFYANDKGILSGSDVNKRVFPPIRWDSSTSVIIGTPIYSGALISLKGANQTNRTRLGWQQIPNFNVTSYNGDLIEGKDLQALGGKNLCSLCKKITSSDIIAYQATGHMGALFLGEAMDKSVAVSGKRLASEAAIFIDNEAVPCTLVGGTLYITNTAVSGDITSAGDVYEVLKDNTETATTLSMEDSV